MQREYVTSEEVHEMARKILAIWKRLDREELRKQRKEKILKIDKL